MDESQLTTELGKYLENSGILKNRDKIRVSPLKESAGEDEVMDGIKELITE